MRKEASILLVEDDPDHVELALRALEKHGVANQVFVDSNRTSAEIDTEPPAAEAKKDGGAH